MEKLTTKLREQVTKMSTERLRLKLCKAGSDDEAVEQMSRDDLMQAYAAVLLSPPSEPAAAAATAVTGGMSSAEFELRQRELEMRQQEWEWRRAETEKERIDRAARDEKEQEWRLRDYDLRAAELDRQRQRDIAERDRRDTLTSQTKYFGDALKHALPRMCNDAGELPGYFKAVENLFQVYQVPAAVQSKLLIPLLTEKAKSLIARLSVAKLDNYKEVRDFLLREFRLSPEQYRDKFLTVNKNFDETYTLFGSKLKNLFQYYMDSRKVTTMNELMELMIADRIKRSLPEHCLKHVLTTEAGNWLSVDKLTNVIDIYMASHFDDRPKTSGNYVGPRNQSLSTAGPSQGRVTDNVYRPNPTGNLRSNNRPVECWKCHEFGHRSNECVTSQKSKSGSNVTRNGNNGNNQTQGRRDQGQAGVHAACVASEYVCPGYKPIIEIPTIRIPNNVSNSACSDNETIRINECSVCLKADSGWLQPNATFNEPCVQVQACDDWSRDLAVLFDEAELGSGRPLAVVVENESLIRSPVVATDLLSMDKPLHANSLHLSKLEYMPVNVNGVDESLHALKDSGAEIGIIQPRLIQHLNLPFVGQITIRGIVGKPVDADLVMLEVKPCPDPGYRNIVPYIPMIFAVCEISTGHDMILSAAFVQQLNELKAYDVVEPNVSKPAVVEVDAMVLRSRSLAEPAKSTISNKDALVDDKVNNVDPLIDGNLQASKLHNEQFADESLQTCWSLAEQDKGNFLVKDKLLYHRDQILGQTVQQLCLPISHRLLKC